jgi:SAM-dependent methyltransferase
MIERQTTPDACPVCSACRIHEKPFGYSFNGRWLGGYGCDDCGIIFLFPQPSPAEIVQMYSKEYFEGDFRCGHAGSYFDEQTQSSLEDTALLNNIKKLKSGGTFLEIGCAGGAFLHAAQKSGYTVRGVEFSDVAAKLAREKFGLDVMTGDIAEARFPDNTFDVVFMGDVLEHLPDPVATCTEVHRIMAPGGIFVIECPMQTNAIFSRMGFLLYGLAGKKTTVHLPPYHLFEYRPGSMAAMLRRCGFDIVRKSEGIIPPRQVTLRGTGLQKAGKLVFQYPNYVVTNLFGVLGDRIEMIAVKPSRGGISQDDRGRRAIAGDNRSDHGIQTTNHSASSSVPLQPAIR